MADFDLSGLDAFANEIESFDFMSEVQAAQKQIEHRTLRQRKNVFTIRSMLDLDDSLALAGDSSFDAKQAVQKDTKFAYAIGTKVWARFDEDELYYEAIVTRTVSAVSFIVTFCGYNNEQGCCFFFCFEKSANEGFFKRLELSTFVLLCRQKNSELLRKFIQQS
jgi:hypothetical protein